MIDIIGDIHGHADKLEALLNKLGYHLIGGAYSHPERKVLFIGDYIDRGPKIRETLSIVKDMVDKKNAIALMGNHEYNAILFNHVAVSGGHLREHSIKNILQHYETLAAFIDKQSEYDEYIAWFKTLPLFYENEGFRAVHACWDVRTMSYLSKKLSNGILSEELIKESAVNGSKLYDAIEVTLKGKELNLPNDGSFKDKDGNERREIRIKWWEDASQLNYQQLCVGINDNVPALPINKPDIENLEYYSESEKPVFFGHYWLKGEPFLIRENICCTDFSVAENGCLVAYRYDGETVLSNSKLVSV